MAIGCSLIISRSIFLPLDQTNNNAMTLAAGRSASVRSGRDPHQLAHKQWEKAIEALRSGHIEPVRIGAGYRIGLLLVAAAMLVLPLIYLALIALVGWGIIWYAINGTLIFEAVGSNAARGGGRVGIVLLVMYLAPIVAGGILLLFMVKPFFAKHVRDSFPLSLNRAEEPGLFEFVDRLCRLVGAPFAAAD